MTPSAPPLFPACVALGANLGDRAAVLHAALRALPEHGVRIDCASSFIETEPVGGPPGQGRYLNGAAVVQTALTPRALLAALLEVERLFGRVRTPDLRNTPRTLDLDLLFYADLTLAEEGLVVPHPRLHERAFVLRPLAEIAPAWRHPQLGLTVAELLARLPE